MNPNKIDRDSETGEYYEVENWPTKADYIIGGLWFVVGIFGLIRAAIAHRIRTVRGW